MTKDDLIGLVRQHALKFGDFELKSGQRSNFYLDCRKITLLPAGLIYIVRHMQNLLDGVNFDAIGGPCVGADPIVGAYLLARALPQPELRGFLVRKEEKGHGLAGLVIGSVREGDRCVVVEDVTTTAGSLLKAADAVREAGCIPVMGVTLIDRSGGAAALAVKQNGMEFKSILTLSDLGL